MKSNLDIHYSKVISKIKNVSYNKECFHYDKSSCSKGTINAHRLQENGILSILEEEVDGNSVLYSFGSFEICAKGPFQKLKYIGKKKASTFKGFCQNHDNKIFSAIEQMPFDINNNEHCFLQTYRNFAGKYYRQKEIVNIFNSPTLGFKDYINQDIGILNPSIRATIQLVYLEKQKEILNTSLKEKKFDDLIYFKKSYNHTAPLASALIQKIPNSTTDNQNLYTHLSISILPFKNETHVILSCFKENKIGKLILECLNKYDSETQDRFISLWSINPETYMAPSFWSKFDDSTKLGFFEIVKGGNDGINLIKNLTINFFDKEYEIKR